MHPNSRRQASRGPVVAIIAGCLVCVLALVATSADRSADAQGQNRDRSSSAQSQDNVYRGQGKASTPPRAQELPNNTEKRGTSPPIKIDGQTVRSGEFVITYKDKFKADKGAAKEKDKGAKEVRELERINARVIEYDDLKDKDKADKMKAKKAQLEKRADVKAVDYNVVAYPSYVPDD